MMIEHFSDVSAEQYPIIPENFIKSMGDKAAAVLRPYSVDLASEYAVIRKQHFQDKVPSEGQPVIHTTIGAPGTGKTTIFRQGGAGYDASRVTIDFEDTILQHMPSYKTLIANLETDRDLRAKLAEENRAEISKMLFWHELPQSQQNMQLAYFELRSVSQYFQARLVNQAVAGRYNINLPQTGTGPHAKTMLNTLKQLGYEIELSIMLDPQELAPRGIKQRLTKPTKFMGTHVSWPDVVGKAKLVPEAINDALGVLDGTGAKITLFTLAPTHWGIVPVFFAQSSMDFQKERGIIYGTNVIVSDDIKPIITRISGMDKTVVGPENKL